jgi:AcrR family transcriptional regulator
VRNKEISTAVTDLQPVGLTPESNGLQDRKSSATREVILEAAIECLARYGYSRTTNELICGIANISRGAMLHHYSNRQELIVAVTEYAFYKHMKSFSTAIRALTDADRKDRNAGVAVDWANVLSSEYTAYFELHMAARTDEALRKIFLPRARHHDRAWKDELLHVFPEWRDDVRKLELTRRLIRSLLEGMALNRTIWNDADAEASLLGFIADVARRIREDKLEFPAAEAFPIIKSEPPPVRRLSRRIKSKP